MKTLNRFCGVVLSHALGLVVLLFLFVNALASSTGRVPYSAACATTTTLRVAGWGEVDPETQLLKNALSQFHALNPCIVATYSPINGGMYAQEIQRELTNRSEPDVFYVSPDMIATEGRAGLLLKLDPYLARDHVTPRGYIPALLKIFQISGATYGLPKDWGTAALLYNKDIFAANHVPTPTNNLTYAQFRALAKRLTSSTPRSGTPRPGTPRPGTPIYGTMMPTDFNLFATFLYGFGSSIFDPASNKILFNNASAIKALTYYTNFQLVDHSAPTSAMVDGQSGLDSFGLGKVAMVIEGSWLLPGIRVAYPHLHFGVAEIPIGPAGRAAPLFTNSWSASARTWNPAAAAKLIAYLTASPMQTQQLHLDFALPTLTALQSDPYLHAHPEVNSFFKVYIAGKPANFGRYDSTVNRVLSDAVTTVLLRQQTAAQALSTAASTLQSQITNHH